MCGVAGIIAEGLWRLGEATYYSRRAVCSSITSGNVVAEMKLWSCCSNLSDSMSLQCITYFSLGPCRPLPSTDGYASISRAIPAPSTQRATILERINVDGLTTRNHHSMSPKCIVDVAEPLLHQPLICKHRDMYHVNMLSAKTPVA